MAEQTDPVAQLPRLQVTGLSTSFMTERGRVQSVADVSFTVPAGRTLALVGESGSGKSVTNLSLMGLHDRGSRPQIGGQALFQCRDGRVIDLIGLSAAQFRQVRGNEIAMVFQEPMTSLNPLLKVGEQIAESVRLHWGYDRNRALAHAQRMLAMVEIPAAARRLNEYPHQLSGGMRQRVMIAIAMACTPTLLIADEPTTALDVTIQAQILALMGRLQKESGMSILFVTHNLGVVAQYADEIAVMYAGRIVERGEVHQLFAQPTHPYTRALLDCLPALARRRRGPDADDRPRLPAIQGQVASPFAMPPGCAFRPRCPVATPECDLAMPPLYRVNDTHYARCIRVKDHPDEP
ncbi:ABC transporter ATP-binding protein [Castellaniella sp.]|uniref:ABC transporter ATP-binding protein n=1 Tax=Castellaniella sp. TaxID=1955812 RepID=UPI002AFEDF07|nr:ABC transporter ATP-binding protein [Castellaniella sp.]